MKRDMELTEKEMQLISYFRSMSEFNKQRILASSAAAADAFKRTELFKSGNKRHPAGESGNR
jgi:hypothetical protein